MPYADREDYNRARRKWRARQRARHSSVGKTAGVSPPESCQPEPVQSDLPLDELIVFALDTFERIDGLVLSAYFKAPYAVTREGCRLKEPEREKFVGAAQKVVRANEAFLNQHGSLLQFGTRLSAVQAAKLETLILDVAGDRPLQLREILAVVAIMFAPLLLILGLVWISKSRS